MPAPGQGTRAGAGQGTDAGPDPTEADQKRKYVPAEAYRLMVLVALEHRRGRPATKGELAREVRANHYMITRVLGELSRAGHVEVGRVDEAAGGEAGYAIRITEVGTAFLDGHRTYLHTTFADTVAQHFRFGRRPPWASGLVAPGGRFG